MGKENVQCGLMMNVSLDLCALPLLSGKIFRVAFFALLLCCFQLSFAAYPRSFASSGLGAPSLPSDDDNVELPPYTVKPFSEAYFTWQATNLSDGTWIMNGTFNFSNGEYVAIGLNSDKKMNGQIIICNANSSSSSATCYDYVGSVYSIAEVPDDELPSDLQAITTAAASAGGITLISFSKVVHSPSRNVSIVAVNGYNRMIFSRGRWGAAPSPRQHHIDDCSAFMVNFVTGSVDAPQSTTFRYVLYPAIALMVVVAAALRIAITCCKVRISDRVRLVGVISFFVAFAAVIAAYILVYYSDYKLMVKPKASFRAVGQGAVAVLCSMMLPVARRFFFSDFFAISPERAVKFHMFGGMLLVFVGGIHGAGMWYQYGTAGILRWRDKDAVSRIPGLLAYILVVVQVSIAVCRHKIGFQRFRTAHYLYVPIIFLLCCHAPIVAYGIIPTIALFFIVHLYKRFFTRFGPHETVLRASADHAAQVVVLDIVCYDFVPPASYYFITLPDLTRFAHPFSVYRCSTARSTQILRFVIRNTEVGYRKADSPAGNGVDVKQVVPASGTWTGNLFRLLDGGSKLTSYRLDGPYGIFEHDPYNYFNYIVVAGGAGITSVAGMLFKLADADEKSIGRPDAKTNFLMIWVVPDPSWVHLLGEDIAQAKQTLKRTCPNLKANIKIFVTNSRTLDSKYVRSIASSVTNNVQVTYGQRPNFGEEFRAFEQQQKKFFITSSDGRINTLNSAVMYTSGPPSLMDAATEAARMLVDLRVEINRSAQSF